MLGRTLRPLIASATLFWSTSAAADATSLPKGAERLTLDNGVNVVIEPVAESPTVAVCTTFRTSTDVPLEAIRVAQHSLLAARRTATGTDPVQVIEARGGRVEAEVTNTTASHCTVVPSTELETAVWLEAERLRPAGLSRAAFDRATRTASGEVDALLARRFARARQQLQGLVFQGDEVHQRTLLGRQRSKSASFAQVAAIRSDHFTGSRAVVSIVGSVKPKEAAELARKQLAALPRSPAAAATPTPTELRQTSERYAAIGVRRSSGPALFWGWRVDAPGTKQHAAAAVLAEILGSDTSPFERALVGRRLAKGVRGRLGRHALRDFLAVEVRLVPGVDVRSVEAALEVELARLRKSGPTAAELLGAQRRRVLAATLARESNLLRARALGRWVSLEGRTVAPWREVQLLRSVTAADIKRVVAQRTPTNRKTTVEAHLPLPPEKRVRKRKTVHVVKRGESLTVIAAKYGISVQALADANGINPKKPIHPGQKLAIRKGGKKKSKPKPRVYVVKKGDALSTIAKRHGVSLKALLSANGLNRKRPIRPGQKLVIPRK